MEFLNEARIAVTVASFIAFFGIVLWASSSRRKQDYARAARMALDDELPGQEEELREKESRP
jgi:cbb3-type cytochrome oxidase subunit 3